MKLDLSKIKEIACGAVRAEEKNGCAVLSRFTAEQELLYKNTNTDFYEKSRSSAGIVLSFETDSTQLFLSVGISKGSSRRYFSFDVFSNEKCIGNLDNFSDVPISGNYTQTDFPHGRFSKSFDLGEGLKHVKVYFPWSAAVEINEISLCGGTFVKARRPKKKLLFFGDSITQGYDALRPSNRYASRISRFLDAEEYNKAIGGEIFFPALAKLKDNFTPDYIFSAYGTNDWNRCERNDFFVRCEEFYSSLHENYPKVPIFALTPLWRGDMNEHRDFGSFADVGEIIRSAVKNIENIHVINGFDFVPHDKKLFADMRLHPNDDGFAYYYENLLKKVGNL